MLELEDEYADHGLIFCQASGRPLDARNLLQRDFWGSLRRAGLRRIRFHDLRHTFAALLIAEGAHAKAIQEAMGHSSIVVTMNTCRAFWKKWPIASRRHFFQVTRGVTVDRR